MRTINPKSEYRNPKQILNSNAPNSKQSWFEKLGFGKLGFVSNLGFSISNLTVPIAIVLTIACLFLPQAAQAAEYYLDAVNGLDTNPGTSEQPWKTLTKAQSTVTSGDTVIVKNGSYGIYSERAVNRTDWVTYRAAEGHHPVLTKIDVTTAGYNDYTVYNGYLVFDGFNIRTGDWSGTDSWGWKGGIRFIRSNHIRLYNLDIEGCEGVDQAAFLDAGRNPAVLISYSDDVIVTNCKIYTIRTIPRYGFSAGIAVGYSSNVEISDCNISDAWQNISIGNNNNVVIKDCDIYNPFADNFVFSKETNFTFEHNLVHHHPGVYFPTLNEDPLTTTWDANGMTMSNPNAMWATAGSNRITATNMEIQVVSGKNCLIGEGENYGNSWDWLVTTVDPSGTKLTLSKGIALRALEFTSGGTYEIKKGHIITGANSVATAYVYDISLTSGSWANGDAAGTLRIYFQTGVFASEVLNIGTSHPDVASIAGDSTQLQVSDVNYYIKSANHPDLIQEGYGISNNVIVRGNQFYDNNGQYGNIKPMITSGEPNSHGDTNSLYENNLFWNAFPDHKTEEGRYLNISNTKDLIFRNNTVIGTLRMWTNDNIHLYNNIISFIQSEGGMNYDEENYNIINRGYLSPYGANDMFLHPGKIWEDPNFTWHDPNFTSIFADYANGDFRLASATSLGVGHGDPANYPATDILGNLRDDGQPDAGCYEYGATSPTTGDINNDSSIDAVDLQLLINMILSGSFDSKADLNSDSSVDAIDLQALVNIILGA